MQLKRMLKKHSMYKQAADILETTNIPARPEDLESTYFKPLYRPVMEWGSGYHFEQIIRSQVVHIHHNSDFFRVLVSQSIPG